jgi:YD repeat-containing protein
MVRQQRGLPRYEATGSGALDDGGDEVTGLDRFGRIIDQDYVHGSTVTDRIQYGYDADGNVLYANNLVNTDQSNLYTYDGLNRLTSFQQGTLVSGDTSLSGTAIWSDEYNFDALGNQLAVNGNWNEANSTYNAQNQLITYGQPGYSTTLSYDNNGNTLTDENGYTYTYDAWNHMIAVKNGDTTYETFAYNADGQRVSQTISGTVTTFYYDASDQDIEDHVGSTVTDQYVWGATYVNDLVERDSGTDLDTRLYAQHDANYDVISLAEGTGTPGEIVERYDYDPYGNILLSTGSITSGWVYGFQDGRLDPITGLYYFENRDDNPIMETWDEQDPEGYINGANL